MKVKTQQQIIDYATKGFAIGEDGGLVKNIRIYRVTVDLPSIADADGGGVNATCTGVALGDVVLGVSSTTDAGDDFVISGEVTAADTVRVTAINHSTGTIDHPSEIFTIVVLQRQP